MFDLFPAEEFDSLMKLGVGHAKTGLEGGASHQDAWHQFHEGLRDATGDDKHDGPSIYDVLALGETLPATLGSDPYARDDL